MKARDSVISSVMKSLGYKRHPMASRESVPVNFQLSGAAWPQVGIKAVALFDKCIGGIDLLRSYLVLTTCKIDFTETN